MIYDAVAHPHVRIVVLEHHVADYFTSSDHLHSFRLSSVDGPLLGYPLAWSWRRLAGVR